MQISKIISEADIRVPNAFDTEKKVDWLNEINQEFFSIVKIPVAASITTDGTTAEATTPANVRSKNITKVMVGSVFYRSLVYENVPPTQNYFTFDDTAKKIKFNPIPKAGTATLVYNLIGTTNFTSTTLTAVPDAPEEFHWIYILGLSARIAKAMNDVTLANNYEQDYKGNLAIAQQNYLVE